LNFLKDTNIIENLVWSICPGMVVAKWLIFDKGKKCGSGFVCTIPKMGEIRYIGINISALLPY